MYIPKATTKLIFPSGRTRGGSVQTKHGTWEKKIAKKIQSRAVKSKRRSYSGIRTQEGKSCRGSGRGF